MFNNHMVLLLIWLGHVCNQFLVSVRPATGLINIPSIMLSYNTTFDVSVALCKSKRRSCRFGSELGARVSGNRD